MSTSSTSTTVDFSDLPPELLLSIATSLHSLPDYIRFRAVCRNWLSAAPLSSRHHPPEFPWLILPLINHPSPSNNRLSFLNPLSRTLHRLPLPEASPSCRRAGSSHGWLILIDESPSVFMINPLTRAKIALPPLSSFPNVVKYDVYAIGREYTLLSPDNAVFYYSVKEMRDCFIKKIVLSNDRGKILAFAIPGDHGCLAYCECGDDRWRVVEEGRFYNEDVIYFDGKFYAVDKFGSVAICDVDGNANIVKIVEMEEAVGGDMQYLVDGMGELLLVSRYLEFDIDGDSYLQLCKTVKFCVFRMDMSVWRWERVSCLEDKVLFLGQNSSFALLASDYKECKGNRIYFTDDYSGANVEGFDEHDVGVYDLGDGSIEPLPCYPRNSHWPIWITPSLC